MRLNAKILAIYAIVGILLLLVVGFYAGASLREDKFQSIYDNYVSQLYQVDFALTSFLVDVEYDVQDLVNDERVRTGNDRDFTNFLDADEATFEYNYGETELAIINIFNTYRTNHPYANSVYMGRENGGFVRSHPRARPTQYDPRQRPWYQLAVSDPAEVRRTAPYRSVTTPDVNIGTVKALVDEQGQVYGVVGIDITLRNLTDYISDISVGEGSYIVLLDDQGTVLTGPNAEAAFKRYDEAGLDYFQTVMDSAEGYTSFEENGERYYLFYYTSLELGWKISAITPVREIDRQVNRFVGSFVLLLTLSLLLLSVLTVFAIQWFIVRPIRDLEHSAETIIQTGDLDRHIAIDSQDEIGQLADSFSEMVASIKQAGEELAESEEKYRSLVENINVGVFRTTVDGRLLHANSAAVRIMGYDSLNEVLAIYVPDLYQDPQDREFMLAQLAKGESIKDFELRLVKKDGTAIWSSVGITAQLGPDGKVLCLEGVLEDITARKMAEDALHRAHDELETRVAERTADLKARNAELDAFAHTVAHDLKNPVAFLAGSAEMLEEESATLSDEEKDHLLLSIAQSGRKISTIVDELLLLASVREMDEIETYPLDMESIVAEVQQRLRYLTEQVQGEIVLPADWPLAVGHGPWIEEVWTNYVSNALKYGGHPPVVNLGYTILELDLPEEGESKIANRESKIKFWVRDNGPGLSTEDEASLFTPFERLHQVRAEGHGLGLSIVQRIVQRLGGEVGVDSHGNQGQGCTFYFTLPSFPLDGPLADRPDQ